MAGPGNQSNCIQRRGARGRRIRSNRTKRTRPAEDSAGLPAGNVSLIQRLCLNDKSSGLPANKKKDKYDIEFHNNQKYLAFNYVNQKITTVGFTLKVNFSKFPPLPVCRNMCRFNSPIITNQSTTQNIPQLKKLNKKKKKRRKDKIHACTRQPWLETHQQIKCPPPLHRINSREENNSAT